VNKYSKCAHFVDDAAKIIGCWKALAKQELTPDLIGD